MIMCSYLTAFDDRSFFNEIVSAHNLTLLVFRLLAESRLLPFSCTEQLRFSQHEIKVLRSDVIQGLCRMRYAWYSNRSGFDCGKTAISTS